MEPLTHTTTNSRSSVTVVRDSIESINTRNSEINAFVEIYADEALQIAADCDAERERGISRGPLHGLPFGVKDLFLTKNRRTARGSRAFRNFVPSESAPVVERMEKAGAILLGKTTTTELGWSGSSVSELYGPTRNPWNTALTSGGSSSGSAAAIAAGMVPFTLGSDGGGSVRIPASFCGIFAMKGSLGRIPAYPWSATEMLSHAGPMTRTAADSALLFNILKGPDPRDHLALPDDALDYVQAGIDPKTLRIAYAPTLFGFPVDDQVARVVGEAVERLSQAFGVAPQPVLPDWQDPIRIFETLWVAGRGVAYGRDAASADFGTGFGGLVDRAAAYSLADYLDAMKARARFAGQVHAFFEDHDLLLLPTVPIQPFEAELEKPSWLAATSEALPWTAWTPFTYPFNLSGNPAASIPAGLSASGLPVGLQVVGRRYADCTVLSFCRLLEEQAGFHLPLLETLPTQSGVTQGGMS
ncbi:MAG: amidase family protein [Kiloniellales bacterium]